MRSCLKYRVVGLFLCAAVCGGATLYPQSVGQNPPDIDTYIHSSWNSLERSTNECGSVSDTKVSSKAVLYLPFGMTTPDELATMKQRCGIDIRHLPKVIRNIGDVSSGSINHPGLLYLPNPYVVPGGRFNEMYGWNSYFISLGLIKDGRVPLAKGIVENFFFEVAHYGAVLNANRTYYLSRSQPPLLSSMIAEIYGRTHDARWLRTAYHYAELDYALWRTPTTRRVRLA